MIINNTEVSYLSERNTEDECLMFSFSDTAKFIVSGKTSNYRFPLETEYFLNMLQQFVDAVNYKDFDRLEKAISVLADTHYIYIFGLNSVMGCDYIGVDVVRNNDKTLNFYIDVVKYTNGESNNTMSFDIRNGKMCRFFCSNYDKAPIEIYHALNAITSVESNFSDEQIISEVGEALKKVAGAYDVSVRKDPNNPNTMLPFPFVLPNANL